MVSRYKIYPQGLTYLVACLARRINSKTGEKEIIDRHKIGLTKKQSFDGRMRQYDDTTEEINYREGNYEKFFLGYNSLFEKKYPGRDEFFIRTSIEIEEAYRSFIFFDETIERLDNIFFKEFLKILDSKYPQGDKIRLILDNLRVHKSEKVQEYVASVPNRFEFVFTPKHVSWLNLVEGFFSKMTKQVLKGIRVQTKDELVSRIYKYFEEINADPIVYKWSWHLDDIDPSEKVQVDALFENV